MNLIINLFLNFLETLILLGYIFALGRINIKEHTNRHIIIVILLSISSYYIQHLIHSQYVAIIGIMLYITILILFYNLSLKNVIIYTILAFFIMLMFELITALPYIAIIGGKLTDMRNNLVLQTAGIVISRTIAILILIILYKRRCQI